MTDFGMPARTTPGSETTMTFVAPSLAACGPTSAAHPSPVMTRVGFWNVWGTAPERIGAPGGSGGAGARWVAGVVDISASSFTLTGEWRQCSAGSSSMATNRSSSVA